MYTHFNQHDPSITDAQDALLQEKLPGKLGNIRLGDLLLIEHDKDGNTIDTLPGKLQNYIAEPEYQKGDIWIPTMSPTAKLKQGIKEIQGYSEAHPRLTLAFDGTHKRFRIAYLGPIQRNTREIGSKDITSENIGQLRFFQGRTFLIRKRGS